MEFHGAAERLFGQIVPRWTRLQRESSVARVSVGAGWRAKMAALRH
jgi:hypothetical protein